LPSAEETGRPRDLFHRRAQRRDGRRSAADPLCVDVPNATGASGQNLQQHPVTREPTSGSSSRSGATRRAGG